MPSVSSYLNSQFSLIDVFLL